MADAGNDDGDGPGRAFSMAPDPHGEAALLLIESLIHNLLARSNISNHDALEIVQTAIDVQTETCKDRDDMSFGSGPLRLLINIAASLRTDQPQTIDINTDTQGLGDGRTSGD